MSVPVDPAVAAVFATFPADATPRLARVRDVIFDVAAATPGVGPIRETLRWGEPSYVTEESGSGSTVRLAMDRASGGPAVHFICTSGLVAEFRQLYPDVLDYVGDRSILLGEDTPDRPELRHCLALAMTHHRRRKAGRRVAA